MRIRVATLGKKLDRFISKCFALFRNVSHSFVMCLGYFALSSILPNLFSRHVAGGFEKRANNLEGTK